MKPQVSALHFRYASGKIANFDTVTAMRVHILVLNGVFDLGLASLTDTLSTANQLAGLLEDMPAPIVVTLVGVRQRVSTAQGLNVPVVPVSSASAPSLRASPSVTPRAPMS